MNTTLKIYVPLNRFRVKYLEMMTILWSVIE